MRFDDFIKEHKKALADIEELKATVGRLTGSQGVGQLAAAALDGQQIATYTGRATITEGTGLKEFTWTKVRSAYPCTIKGGTLAQFHSDGYMALDCEIRGVYSGSGFHRYDAVDGVKLCVLNGLGANFNGNPVRQSAYIRSPDQDLFPCRRSIHGYGNSVQLGCTWSYTHHDPLGGQSFGQPTAIDITMIVSRVNEG